ncbi:type II secretion system protein [Chloroflexota bacterium]
MTDLLRRLKRVHRGEQGMTLIELVVVVAILGILAAIIVPNVASWIGEGQEEAAKTELYDVQLAMTAVMAKAVEPAVYAQTTPVVDLTGLPQMPDNSDMMADLDGDGTEEAFGMDYYLVDPVSDGYQYTWDDRGKISQTPQ